MAQQIVHNTGVNYTLYYNALNYFKTIMQNHPSINAVTQGDITKLDTDEFSSYPLGNILITESNFGNNVTNYTIQLTVADKIKNKNNESNDRTNAQTIPFYRTDDTVDIHANTLGILNDLTSYTQRGVAGFEINGDINCTAFSDQFNNGLAGWVATFELTTHNDKNRCLFFLINPSGSGYQIQNCATSESYYAVLSSQVATGSVFSSTYPYTDTCYQVLQEVEEFDNWNLVNLPVLKTFPSCSYCTFCATGDIVRDGLIMAFDWTSFNQNGTLTDKSGNGYNANWSGSLTTSSNALEFDGTSSYIAFDINANSMYNSWKWTIDTYGIINDVDNASTFGSLIAYNFTDGSTPAWSFAIQTSGSTTPDLITYNNLVVTKDAPIITSLTLPHQFTYIGREKNLFGSPESEISLSMDTNHLSGSGSGRNIVLTRSFNGTQESPGTSSFSLQKFGGPGLTYESPFGPITWNALSGSIQYILYYNRDLTQAEVEQNNKFYYCNNPITS